MKRVFSAILLAMMLALPGTGRAVEYMREITVAQDGSGDFTTLTEAMEAIRAFMDYKVTVHIKPGTYSEKVIVPAWLENVEFVGESPDNTIITWSDHANINKMGTFRTYTMRVDGTDLTFRNLTIENNAERKGQAVALHTEGDCLQFVNCRFLGNQDTIYTGGKYTRMLFDNCYIEGTTDFIFGPATALFRDCELHSKSDSFVTAASTPADVEVGYVFHRCHLTADPEVTKVYLGRPWRPYAMTVFVDCEMDGHIVAPGWHNWKNPDNEKTARYGEIGSRGAGARGERVAWSRNDITPERARQLTDPAYIFNLRNNWNPTK